MENVKDLLQSQSGMFLPLAIIVPVICAVLLFVFGFKSPKEPSFTKLTADDRKAATQKKRKIKEKKTTANGHVSTGEAKATEKSPVKEAKKSPAKETEKLQKEKKVENKQAEKKKSESNNKQKTIEEAKNKKNTKKAEKPVDFDDGNWETVVGKGEKKKKQESSPAKKDKKIKKIPDKVDPMEIEKFVKEVVNKELREQEKEKEAQEPVVQEIVVPTKEIIKEPVAIIEEKKEKKKEKKPKKEPVVDNKEKEEKPKQQPKPQIVEEKVEAAKEAAAGQVAFDELGDVWTEAKLPKKNKKKARRDN